MLLLRDISRNLILGSLSLGISLMILILQPSTFIRNKALILTDKGIPMFYDIWRDPVATIGTTVKVYVFNVTNKDEFLEGKEKLRLQEVGPYIYQERTVQMNPVFKENVIESAPRSTLTWIPHINKLREDDMLVMPNVALLAIGSKAASEMPMLKMTVNLISSLTDSTPFIEQTFKEFAFNYKSPLISKAHTLFPQWIYFKEFGILDRIFDFENDKAVTYTGKNDTSLTGILYSYNGGTSLPYWDHPCNRIYGTSSGLKFGENLRYNETVYLYRKPICRALPLIPDETVSKESFGISSTLYKIQQSALDNGARIEENKCFCRRGYCLADGLMDVTDCFYGFPIASSNPHFYNNDLSLLEQFDGLEPDKNLHESQFFINRELGVLTQANLRVQINIVHSDTNGITHCNKFAHKVLPLLWLEVEIPELPLYLKFTLFLLLKGIFIIETATMYLLSIIGFILIISASKTLVYVRVK